MAKLIGYIGVGAFGLLADLGAEFERRGDLARSCQCLIQVADIACRRAEYQESETIYQRAIPILSALGDWPSVAHCLEWQSDIARARREFEKSEALCDEAILYYQKARALGHSWVNVDSMALEMGLADAYWSKGELYRVQRRWEDAQRYYQMAQALFKAGGSLRGRANCLRGVANIALDMGDDRLAMATFLRAQEIYEQIATPLGLAYCLAGMGRVHHARRDHSLALEAYEAALKNFNQVQQKAMIETCRGLIAQARQGRPFSGPPF